MERQGLRPWHKPETGKNKPVSSKPREKFTFIKWLWLGGGSIFLLVSLFLISILSGLFGELPATTRLENPRLPLATQIYSADGQLLGKYYRANREPIAYGDLSDALRNTLIATEDSRFFQHSGVDFSRTLTIIPYNLIGKRQGASTITQQLAKHLFPRKKTGTFGLVVRKIKEWFMAIKLERLYTKEEIMAMYLNTVEFGNNAIGIKSAAKTYFGIEPKDLDYRQSALLIGLLQNPTRFNPVYRPEKALARRNTVVGQLYKYDYINSETKRQLMATTLGIDQISNQDHATGLATYFREYLRKKLASWSEANGVDLYTDGLKIYTTIDSRMQKIAEAAVTKHMRDKQQAFYRQFERTKTKPWTQAPDIIMRTVKRTGQYKEMKANGASETEILAAFNKPHKIKIFTYSSRYGKDTFMSAIDSIKYYKYFLQPGFLTMEPNTGHIKTWVGGLDMQFFQYDHCAPSATRQVGSTFKPFVYAVAIEKGTSPCQQYPNTDVIFEDYDNWSPRNSDNVGEGQMMTLYRGLAGSVNKVTARVMKEVGIKPVISMARRLGLTTQLDPVPSLCLGVADVSLYEMVAAYNTFNSEGMYIEPMILTEIQDKGGNTLARFAPSKKTVLDKSVNYTVLDLLRGVLNCRLYGSACRMRYKYGINAPMAGKTGTTQNQADGWFMGLIPQLTGGVWVGCEDPAVHFTDLGQGQGAELAMPIWAYFLQEAYKDASLGLDPKADWKAPDGLSIELNCANYEETQPSLGESEKVNTAL